MTEEQANLPAEREDGEIEKQEVEERPSSGWESDHFYTRRSIDDVPVVVQRPVKLSAKCKMCRLVPNLMEENDYTFEMATDVERDFYRFVYTFWSAREITAWLKKTHEYEVSHQAVSNHISSHVPSPHTAMRDRIIRYQPDYMNKQFFSHIADTMKMIVLKFQGQVMAGEVPMSMSEFLKVIETLKTWQEFLGDISQDKTDMIIQAVGDTLEEVLGEHQEIYDKFSSRFAERLEELEKDGEEE